MSEAATNRNVVVFFVGMPAPVTFPVRVFARHFGSHSFCLSRRSSKEEIELVADSRSRYNFSVTSQ